MRRVAAGVAILFLLGAFPFALQARADDPCASRLLVLSAIPVEIGPLLAQTTVDHRVEIGGRVFTFGVLKGNRVMLAMTGIGLENAAATTQLALDQFGCSIAGVVFSGTSGGKTSIGDVVVPARWTLDGITYHAADASMRMVAQQAAGSLVLSSDAALGDVACSGVADPNNPPVVHFDHEPTITFGDGTTGRSGDPFGGNPLPCIPGGGDVFGCRPCTPQTVTAEDAARFATGAAPFLTPEFFRWYAEWSSAASDADAVDMESAAVAEVAYGNNTPFIVFRALSDGEGDPLGLPGFPFQFFAYRQYAAANAAVVALAFLNAWGQAH